MISGNAVCAIVPLEIAEPAVLLQLTPGGASRARRLSHIRSGLGFRLRLGSYGAGADGWPGRVGLDRSGNPGYRDGHCSLACRHGWPRPVTVQTGNNSDSRVDTSHCRRLGSGHATRQDHTDRRNTWLSRVVCEAGASH